MLSSDKLPDEDLVEDIKILATDDEKIKLFGEIFTNDSSREILQLLFNEELTATQIAQKSNVSLQLVKYHINKLQALGIVKISKIEKNSKSQDMKIYTATKFSIVIVPPKLSEKTKESKLLVRSFRHIYKVVGLGIATGLSGLFSLSQIQQGPRTFVSDSISSKSTPSSVREPEESFQSDEIYLDESAESISASPSVSTESAESISASPSVSTESAESISASPSVSTESESQSNLDTSEIPVKEPLEPAADIANSSNELAALTSDLFAPFVIITLILGGMTIYYLYKFFKKS